MLQVHHPSHRLEQMSHRKCPSELMVSPVEKERPQGEYPVSEYCRTFSGKTSWVSPQVDHSII